MKKIISIISSLALAFSMMTMVSADAKPEAFVDVKSQTDSEIVLSLGVNANGTGIEYFKSIYMQVEIPESILKIVEDVFANKATSKEIFIASNPTNKVFKFNPNIWSYKYEAYGSVNGDMNYSGGKLILSQAIADGASLPADGILAEVTLPLNGAIASDVELTIPNASINTTDFSADVKYGYGDPAVIGACADVLTVVGDTLKGATVERPTSCIEKTDAFTFDGLKAPYVKITNSGVTKNYFLPAGVVGTTETYGILKYNTADVTKGSEFVLELWETGAAAKAQSLGSIIAE